MTPMLDDFVNDTENLGFEYKELTDDEGFALLIDESRLLDDWIHIICKACNAYNLTYSEEQFKEPVLDWFLEKGEDFVHYRSKTGLLTLKELILEDFSCQTEVLFIRSLDTLREDYRDFCFLGYPGAKEMIEEEEMSTTVDKESEMYIEAYNIIRSRAIRNGHRVFYMKNRYEVEKSIKDNPRYQIPIGDKTLKVGYVFDFDEFA